ncbi:MAG TPA: glycosyltransferase family 2 protein [Chitinophagaceae bacterium]|nr:glycosyltransferase family 2 protein [Chitinophagaceae bacterium]
MKLVSLITLNLDQPAVTEALLDSLFSKNKYPNIEIIVVDNNSKVNPIPKWEEKYPSVLFIRAEKNFGFTGGNNLGIKYAKGDFLFVINNDTEVTENLIGRLVDVLEKNPQIGVISPKINYFDQPDVLQYTGYTKMNYYTARNRCLGQYEKDRGQYDYLTGKTGYAHGAAMLVRREVIEKVGAFSDNFFIYYEELDWCERIKKAGYEVWIDMKALLYHKESMTVGKHSAFKEYYMNRNRILFNRKHAPPLAFIIFTLYFTVFTIPKTLVTYIRKKQYSFIRVFWRAIEWNLKNGINSSEAARPM